jgi:hypothetical protein
MLALTSPTGGGRSVGMVRLRTKATEFVFVSEVCAYRSSEPITPSAHTAYAGFSSLVKLAALYAVLICSDQFYFVKRLLIGLHDACLFAAGTVAWLLTATVSKPKLSSVIQLTSSYQHIKKTPRHERSSGGKERVKM